jgi:hypothetical protein
MSEERSPCVWDRVPIILSFAEQLRMTETYGFNGSQGRTVLEGQRLLPRDRPSDTVYLFMHPTSTLQLLPMPMSLADAGLHVICAGSRYAKNDSALIMEKVAFDLGVYIRHARDELGYKKVILVGPGAARCLSSIRVKPNIPQLRRRPRETPMTLSPRDCRQPTASSLSLRI